MDRNSSLEEKQQALYAAGERSAARLSDPDKDDKFYLAEMEVIEQEFGDFPLPKITENNVAEYMIAVAQKCGLSKTAPLDVRFELAGDPKTMAYHRVKLVSGEEYFNFNPDRLSAPIALHELAHSFCSSDGHGPQFCGILIGLWRHGIGIGPALELASALLYGNVSVLAGWAEFADAGITDFDSPHGPRVKPSCRGQFLEPSDLNKQFQG